MFKTDELGKTGYGLRFFKKLTMKHFANICLEYRIRVFSFQE